MLSIFPFSPMSFLIAMVIIAIATVSSHKSEEHKSRKQVWTPEDWQKFMAERQRRLDELSDK